jgi:hypothetical protein
MQHKNIFACLQQIGIEHDFIPAGYTPVLQVLYKGVHKHFEQYLRDERTAFMVNNAEGAKPTQLDIAQWIQNHGIKSNNPPFSTPGSPFVSIHLIIIS